MNRPHAATLGDLAGRGELEGCRVRFLAEDIPSWVPKGSIGIVSSVSTYEPKATVRFVFDTYPPGNPWRERSLETRFRHLELVE